MSRHIRNMERLLADIAAGVMVLEKRAQTPLSCVRVILLEAGHRRLSCNLGLALEYLANDIYNGDSGLFDEEGEAHTDWSNADQAIVETF